MRNTGSPSGDGGSDQLATRERPAGLTGMAERLVVPMKPGITLGVLLRRASQPSNRLSRFLAERSAGFVDGTTPHNHVVFLEPKHIDRTSVDGGEKQ